MAKENHYDTLGVSPSADNDAIKRAYRQKMRQYHPDQLESQRQKFIRENDNIEMHRIERELEYAKTMTQKINAAYDILSDVDKRTKYDRDRKLARQRAVNDARNATRAREAEDWDIPRTGRKSTHDSFYSARQNYRDVRQEQNPNYKPDDSAISPILLGGIVIVLFLAFSFISSFFVGVGSQVIENSRPTAIGMTADELQATVSMQQATYIARTQRALLPTATPLSIDDLIAAGNTFHERGDYDLAIEQYSAAIERDRSNAELFLLRSISYQVISENATDEASDLALFDLNQAIRFDNTLSDAYRERGLLLFARWQADNDNEFADLAQADLLRFVRDNPTDSEVQNALNRLEER